MPYFPVGTLSPLRPGSWPASPGRPTTPQLEDDEYTDEDDLDMPLLQRDPLKYFLTPATPEDEDLEFQFDFDAGIEDANKPQEIIRSYVLLASAAVAAAHSLQTVPIDPPND
ncbi:hypothetical protein KJ359_010900 [Pestalotiopsis sp. 9143b]|nr:hypothetical protein KJ359_010900 [Pestalotiopsis sp. 9143b]